MLYSYCKNNEGGKKADKRGSTANLFMLPWQPGCCAAVHCLTTCNLDRLL